MPWGNHVEIVGNATRDPELRFAQSGTAIASFGIAYNRKYKDGEDKVSFFDITCFRELAENVAESVTKGMRVIISGQLDQRSWQTDDGQRRSKVEIIADEVSPSLRWASAEVSKNERRDSGDPGPRVPGESANTKPAAADTADDEPF